MLLLLATVRVTWGSEVDRFKDDFWFNLFDGKTEDICGWLAG